MNPLTPRPMRPSAGANEPQPGTTMLALLSIIQKGHPAALSARSGVKLLNGSEWLSANAKKVHTVTLLPLHEKTIPGKEMILFAESPGHTWAGAFVSEAVCREYLRQRRFAKAQFKIIPRK